MKKVLSIIIIITIVISVTNIPNATYAKETIVKKKIKFNKKFKYAKYSKIHSGRATLYKHKNGGNGITVAVNAGHGTRGGERYKTLCHPDGSRKLVGGSTAKGAKYSPSISSGTTLRGKSEAAATLSLDRKSVV